MIKYHIPYRVLLCGFWVLSASMLVGCNKDPYAVPETDPSTPTVRREAPKAEPRIEPLPKGAKKKTKDKTEPILPNIETKFKEGGLLGSKSNTKKKESKGFGIGFGNPIKSKILGGGGLTGAGSFNDSTLLGNGGLSYGLKLETFGEDSKPKTSSSRPSSRPTSNPAKASEPTKPKKVFKRTYPWPPEGTIAQVNNESLGAKPFLQRYKLVKKLWALQEGEIEDEATKHKLRRKSLESMITDTLIYQQARAEGIKTTVAERKSALKKLKKTFPKGSTLKDMLKKTKLTRKEFDVRLVRQLIVQKYTQSLVKKINIPRKEVLKRYKKTVGRAKYKVRHIVVPMDAGANMKIRKAVRKRANQIKALATKGDISFAVLAKKYSDDPSAEDGGDLGYLQKGDTLEDLNVIFDMKKGEIRGPVLSPLGFHIIKVTGVVAPPSFLKAYGDVLMEMRKERLKDYLKKKVEELRSTADIKIGVTWGTNLFKKKKK